MHTETMPEVVEALDAFGTTRVLVTDPNGTHFCAEHLRLFDTPVFRCYPILKTDRLADDALRYTLLA